MEFIDLKSQYARLEGQIGKRIKKVLEHGKYILGPEVQELEERLADHCKVKHAITVANGTDALVLSLMSLGVGHGDAVITTAFSFFASAEAISLVGATPVFVDIDEKTFNISAEKLKSTIASYDADLELKAVIAVDLFGMVANYEQIEEICKTNNLYLIEDAAQSFGASLGGNKACSFGDIATTSFFPAKPLGCYGDGGAIFTDDADRAQLLRSLRMHGKGKNKYENVRIGMNSRLDTIQAAILLSKLDVFPDELNLRTEVAEVYSECLKHNNRLIQIPMEPPGYKSVWAQYTIRSNKREELVASLQKSNIPYAIYYERTLDQQPAYANQIALVTDTQVARRVCTEVVSLPMGPYLAREELKAVCHAIHA